MRMKLGLVLALCGSANASAELMLEYAERNAPDDTLVTVIVGEQSVAVKGQGAQRAVYDAAENAFKVVDDVARRSYVLNDKHLQFMALSKQRNFLGQRSRTEIAPVGEEKDETHKLQYKPTERRATVNDYPCERVEVYAASRLVRELCVAQGARLGLSPAAVGLLGRMRDFTLRASRHAPEVSRALPRISLDFYNGVPVEINVEDTGRSLRLTRVTAFRPKDTASDNPFEVPVDYSTTPLLTIRR